MRLARATIAAALILALGQTTPSGMAQGAGETAAEQANFAGWLKEAVRSYLVAELSGPEKTIKSIKVSIPSLFTPPEAYDSFNITIPRSDRRGSKVFLLVSFTAEGRAVSRVNVIADVRVERDVVVARRGVGRGSIIAEEDLAVERRVEDPFGERILSDPAEAVGKQAERNIREGRPVRADYLVWPKMVRNGDIVTIVAESGSMLITTLGKAKQDGDRGDWIIVNNMESKKSITARVTAPGVVMVEF